MSERSSNERCAVLRRSERGVIGVLFNTPVLFDGGKGSVDTNAAFGKIVMLVR